MVSREEAVSLIKDQLDNETDTYKNSSSKCAWHYGKQELRELLDLIYGGEPENEHQEL